MTAKEYLSRYKFLDNQINTKVEQVEQLQSIATRITPSYSDSPGKSSCSDKVGKTVCKITDLEHEINSDINRLLEIRNEIVLTIKQVEDQNLQTLLELRYINCKTWEQIAVKMGYTYRNVLYLHGRALKAINTSLFFTYNL